MKKMHFVILAMAALALFACGNKDNPGGDTPSTEGPAAPAGLALHGDAGETSLTFQWSAAEGAKGYNWKIETGGQPIQENKTSNRNVTVSGLTAATTYTFSVQSVADGKTSKWVSVQATTAGEPGGGGGGGETPDLTKYYAQFDVPQVEEDGKARAFPGAEGGGMWATGGRGGKVYHVTSLNDSSSEQGTLRYGIEKGDRPLVIVFDVAGTIALNSQLNIKKGDLTIAGQTAPGDGICLKNYTFRISASNVVVRFIRCRMGDEKKTEDDAIQIMDHEDDKYQNIVIDHCSVSWCTDECASFYGVKNFTFSWNMVTESLRNSVHGKGSHGYGGIWGGTNATYSHNLLAHHDSRNSRLDHDYVSTQKGPLSMINNVIYNWKGNSTYGGESKKGSDFKKYNILNNYYKPGPATPNNHIWFLDPTVKCDNCEKTEPTSVVPGHFYMTGNHMDGNSGMTADNWTGTTAKSSLIATIKETSAFTFAENPGSLYLHGATDAFSTVLAYAGASLKRDGIDARIAREAKDGTYTYTGSNGSTGGLIDTQTDVDDGTWDNNWPVYSFSSDDPNLKDSDSDGMPNWFEEEFGLNKSDASDAQQYSIDPDKRYTNLELYLHYLVKDIVSAQNQSAQYTNL